MCRKFFIFLLFLISYISIFPQSGSAISTLILPVSPKSVGAGGTGTANIQSDPFGYWSNPAYLGYESKSSFVTGGFFPGILKWSQFSKSTINSYTISAGYNLQQQYKWLPVSVGAAYSKWQFNYRDLWGFDYGSKDYYNAYSIGIGFHSIVNINAGITIKDINSVMEDTPELKSEANVTAMDYGLLINLPLNNFLNTPLKFSINENNSILPVLNYNIGYTIQNVGDEVYYVDPAQKDPLPRTARLAHNIILGFVLNSTAINIELLNFSYSLDAVDNLVQRKWADDYSRISYQGILGGIKPFKNLFQGKGDDEILVRKGLELEFGEILSLCWGGYRGGYILNGTTDGYGLRAKGLFKVLNMFLSNSVINKFFDKVDVQYNYSTYYKDAVYQTKFKSIALTISGF